MDEQASARRVFETNPLGGSRRTGNLFIRWRVGDNLKTFNISNWRQSAGRNQLNEMKTFGCIGMESKVM